jgi:hypothetical protein
MCFLPLGHFALHAILQQYVPNKMPLLADLYAVTDTIAFVRSGPNYLDFGPIPPLIERLSDLATHKVSYDTTRVLEKLNRILSPGK